MLFGAHVSIAEGINRAPERAHLISAECFQFFSRSPQGGHTPKITSEILISFLNNCKKYKFKEYYVHAPYFINLASANDRIYHSSINVITEELERANMLEAKYVMTHIGSRHELSVKEALNKVIKGVKEILNNYSGKTQLLIEVSAGAGNIIGDTFDEIAKILDGVGNDNLGICLDTAHIFASGYDIRTKKAARQTIDEFDKLIGLKRLKLSHINDSRVKLGERKDRHEHIGKGQIGIGGFESLLSDKRLNKINFVLETPHTKVFDDIKILKKIRKKFYPVRNLK